MQSLDISWRDQAACKSVPTETFFPTVEDAGIPTTLAKLCAGCPVKSECLDFAVSDSTIFGIWAGTDEKERRKMRQSKQKGKTPPGPVKDFSRACAHCGNSFEPETIRSKRIYCSEFCVKRASSIRWNKNYAQRRKAELDK